MSMAQRLTAPGGQGGGSWLEVVDPKQRELGGRHLWPRLNGVSEGTAGPG